MASNPEIHFTNRQSRHSVNESRLVDAARRVFDSVGIASGEVSIAVVDDAEIHAVNRQHLEHDYPTDVISFVFDHNDGHLDGEIVVSADYAAAEAERYGWSAENELLLYVVHGALHLIGYDDTNEEAAREMRNQERVVLATFGLIPPGRD
jgi:probable rRNA maturation factor